MDRLSRLKRLKNCTKIELVLLSLRCIRLLDAPLISRPENLLYLVVRNILHAPHDVVLKNKGLFINNFCKPLGVFANRFVFRLGSLCDTEQ